MSILLYIRHTQSSERSEKGEFEHVFCILSVDGKITLIKKSMQIDIQRMFLSGKLILQYFLIFIDARRARFLQHLLS